MAATATAQFGPIAQFRTTSLSLFNQVIADYGLLDPAINPGTQWTQLYGVSPVSLAAQYGLTIVNNATGLAAMPPSILTYTSASQVLGTAISTSANGTQVLSGQNYTDANGQTFTDVTWEWHVAIEYFNPANAGNFNQQAVSWNGDGTNRLIPTTFDLSVGETAILIFSDGEAPVWATSSMLAAGKHATYCVQVASTTAGVMTMGATGFTVLDGAGVGVNGIGRKYQAVVWNDPSGLVMKTGTYQGTGLLHNVASGLSAGPEVVLTTAGKLFGGNADGVFLCADFGAQGFNVSASQINALQDDLVSLSGGTFQLKAASVLTNQNLQTFYYIAFHLTTAMRAASFATWSSAGTGAAQTVTGLGFTPNFAFARTTAFSNTYSGASAAWRGPADTGTESHSTITGTLLPTGGIESFGVGTLGLASGYSPSGERVAGFALSGVSTTAATFASPTWARTVPVDMGDGTIALIEVTQVADQQPGDEWFFLGPNPTFRWWCQTAFGYSVYQVDSPGTGWVACSGPTSTNGWYLSTAAFASQDVIVSAGRPADPRSWAKLSTWCAVGNMAVYGGSPSALANINNHMVYPASGYTVGTDYPPLRIFDGKADRELCRLPPTTANVVPKAVMSMLAANGTVYLTTWDSGTTSADWNGRVMQVDPETGVLVPLGLVFANGELPYALCWHMGRLWCGTNNGIGTVGKIYYFRPGIDTAWTLDYSTATSTAGGVTSMASYKGVLYVGTDNAAASRGKVLARDTAGAYTTSQTGSGGTAKVNNGYLALTVLGNNLYASYWNNDTTPISKIEKFTGSAWSTAYTGVGTTLCPFILLQLDNAEIYAVGGSQPYDAVLLVTADGTTWTDLTAELPSETATALPMFGAVVT